VHSRASTLNLRFKPLEVSVLFACIVRYDSLQASVSSKIVFEHVKGRQVYIIQGVPKKRILSFIFGITWVIQHRF